MAMAVGAVAQVYPRQWTCKSSSSRFCGTGCLNVIQMQCRRSSGKNVDLRSMRSQQLENSSEMLAGFALPRRDMIQSLLALFGSSVLLTCGTESRVFAEESSTGFAVTRTIFFDVAIDGQPVGEIVVGLYGVDVPVGAQRFAELSIGQRGISYRRKEFYKVTPRYIQNAGIRTFSLSGGVGDAASFTGGETAESLVAEMNELDKKGSRPKNVRGAVSLVVADPRKPPPKPKLVARNGKFVILEEESRPDPNGTEFVIATMNSPELDPSNSVVGHVIEGMDVVERIAQVKVVQENSSSPYFQAAKLIGDTRAVVAERGFYRPYSKIVITRSGELK